MGDCMRLKAEWERQRAILLAFPHQHSDWDHYLIEAQICFINIIKTITQFQDVIICMHPDDKQGLALLEQAFCDAPPSLARFSRFSQISLRGLQAMESLQLNDRILLVGIETNDTWARDFGAISLEDAHGSDNGNNSKTSEIVLLDFIFNGWGNKFDSTQDNQITQKLHNLNILKGKLISLPFVLEGGSIDTNGKGVLLTNTQCLLEPHRNPQFTQDTIQEFLIQNLGISQVLWLDYGFLEGDDTDSHIDTLARFISEDTIAYISCDDKNDLHYEALKKMEEQLQALKSSDNKPYNLIKLPFTSPIFYQNKRLPASYANFLFINDALLVPTYNDKNDKLALSILSKACPNHQVIGIDCSVLIRQHGSLHCVTMQLY
ncbi:agmatine deiminase family protein [Helicobacter fennelliae]